MCSSLRNAATFSTRVPGGCALRHPTLVTMVTVYLGMCITSPTLVTMVTVETDRTLQGVGSRQHDHPMARWRLTLLSANCIKT